MTQATERNLLRIVLVLFGVLTAVVIWLEGVGGIFAAIVSSWGAVQIYVDLVIALGLIMVWIYRDARRLGRNPWPWLVATAVVGVFAPLIYLLVRDARQERMPS
jgi:RsiW-degrading membrane proteinase PrsW (M82 family)